MQGNPEFVRREGGRAGISAGLPDQRVDDHADHEAQGSAYQEPRAPAVQRPKLHLGHLQDRDPDTLVKGLGRGSHPPGGHRNLEKEVGPHFQDPAFHDPPFAHELGIQLPGLGRREANPDLLVGPDLARLHRDVGVASGEEEHRDPEGHAPHPSAAAPSPRIRLHDPEIADAPMRRKRPPRRGPGGPRRDRPGSRARGIALLLLGALPLVTGCQEPRSAEGWECIAPANAGGGWDLTCRALARSLRDLDLGSGMMRVVNIPGAGGGIAYAHVVAQRQGDPGVLVAASPATLLRLAQGQFAHLTERDVRWLGAIATDHGVVAVRADAPWEDLASLLEAWRDDPPGFAVSGGSAAGGQDHIKILLLASRAGIPPLAVRYVPFDGGGEAMNALLGGFVHVFSGDVSQVEAQVEAGRLRVLAVLAPRRVGGALATVPAARELGYPVEWVTWRGFYVPAGLPEERYRAWVATLEAVAASEAWAEERRRSRLEPFFLAGEAFEAMVDRQIAEFRDLSRQMGLAP
jgi:putative tricarboxylic transport membrane protein